MNIAGLDKAEVLAALYNCSRQQGMGFLQTRGAEDMTVEQAREELAKNERGYFDYLHGRVMKIDLRGDELETWLYDRDNGQGAAEAIIDALRSNAKLSMENAPKVEGTSSGTSALDDMLEMRRQPPAQMQQEAVDAMTRMAATIEKPKTPDESVWLSIYCAVANCFNSEKATAASWADEGLREFRKRFRL